MTEAELAAIEERATPAAACRNCGGSLDVDPAVDEAACPVHGYCWHCMTRGRHGRECRQSCADVPALVAEVRRLRAALEQLRDGEVSEQPANPPEEPEPFLYCADCTAFTLVGTELKHEPMFTCGIAQAALAG